MESSLTASKDQHLYDNKITVVGSINCDVIAFINRFPNQNQTVLAEKSMVAIGGKGLNQAAAAARAGGKTFMIGKVGDDVFGVKALDYLEQLNVDTTAIKIEPNTETGTANIFVTNDGHNMIAVAPGANGNMTPSDVSSYHKLICGSKVVVVQLELPIETVKRALQIARDANVMTILNPAPARPNIEELLALANIITPNETEVEELTGIYPTNEETARKACNKLRQMGAREIIITMGKNGHYLSTDGYEALVPPIPVQVVDPTGAGDVFNGVLARMLACGMTLIASAEMASAAATLSVTREGAEGTAPELNEINDFIAQNNKKMRL